MDQLFVAPTFLAAVTEVAAIRAGLYGDSGRRVLLTTNNARVPEVAKSIEHAPGFETLAGAFDQIVHLNDYIAPQHPRGWQESPPKAAITMSRILEDAGLEPGVGVTMQSLSVAPSVTIATGMPGSEISVISDGLMSYGPAPKQLPADVAARLTRLLYLDLVPGLEPILFSEYGIRNVLVPTEAFTGVLADYAAGHPERARLEALADTMDALAVGQYLAALGLMTVEEETRLYHDMVASAAELGHRRIAFKPHPSAPPAFTETILAVASEYGVEVRIFDVPVPVEAIYSVVRPQLVVGSFSTALATASLYGIRTASVGTPRIAETLPRYSDSNRIPLMITAATSDRIVERGGVLSVQPPISVDLPEVMRALAGTMHPSRYADWRPAAERFAQAAVADAELGSFFARWEEAQPAPARWTLGRIRRRLRQFTTRQKDRIDRIKLAVELKVPPLTREDFEREFLGR